ncbi:hypothetical protein A3N95_15735 [Mycobacteroides abscessus]|nr:hypothetical protein A3N95_15735 [Mycobacteroides abscessus]
MRVQRSLELRGDLIGDQADEAQLGLVALGVQDVPGLFQALLNAVGGRPVLANSGLLKSIRYGSMPTTTTLPLMR